MNANIETRRFNTEIIIATIGIASLLQWLTYQMLIHAKIGASAESFALAQVVVVLFVSPYLAATNILAGNRSDGSALLLSLPPFSHAKPLLIQLLISQVPLLCWIFLSTGFSLFVTDISIGKSLAMLVVLVLYSLSAGSVGMWGGRVLKDAIFGMELTYCLWVILIGSAFLLKPLDRYIDNPQPIIQPILHLNPLIAVCNIFDGLDIFRNPLLYDLTPLPDYVFSYPTWHVSCFWQLVIGACCFLWTWRLCRSSSFAPGY